MHEQLIAPRPLRLAPTPFGAASGRASVKGRKHIASPSPLESLARIKLTDDEPPAESQDEPPNLPTPGPEGLTTPSPRFSAEALEEFLSILRPTLLSPSSPVSRFRRGHGAGASLSLPYGERVHPYKRDKSRSAASNHSSSDRPSPSEKSEADAAQLPELDAWQASILLSSPISRNQTRNPLPRDPCYEALTSNLVFNTSRTPSPNQSPQPLLYLTAPPEVMPPAPSEDMEIIPASP